MMRNMMARVFAAAAIVVCMTAIASAHLKLPAIFSDNMVLQRDQPIPVWGWADPGEEVTVTFDKQTKKATCDKKGKWTVELDAMKAGGPYTMTVESHQKAELKNILIGEVWLCSGQSNMGMTVRGCLDYEKEQAAADLPKVRMFTVNRTPAEKPQETCEGAWVVSAPDTVGTFSATAYFFGRDLHKELGVPIGLINSSWGGTPVQSWTCLKCQSKESKLKPLLTSWKEQVEAFDPEAAQKKNEAALEVWKERAKKAKAAGKKPPRKPRPQADPRMSSHRPANLYNGMIAPLVPYGIRGAIWYQGESNANRYPPGLYGMQLAMMIQNWRKMWGEDFPFAWVQLPNFREPQQSPSETVGWVIVQNEMLKTLKVPNTGMAITLDAGEATNIHPKDKQTVGDRLARWALASVYGKDNCPLGPVYRSAKIDGGKVTVSFDHVGDGLTAKGGGKLEGFAIAGADKKFVWADAQIDGDKVVVSSKEVKKPAAVRYAWAANPKFNLLNKDGIPASPFRTDDWDLYEEMDAKPWER